MLTSVIIILREFLEASLLVSLLTVLHLKFQFYRHWIFIALAFGLIGAFFYARSLSIISAYFDGSGQEVVNGFALLFMGMGLAYHNIQINCLYKKFGKTDNAIKKRFSFPLTVSAILVIAIAITREGSEAWIYYTGLHIHTEKSSSMLIGGIIGGGLGICIGILIFVLLSQQSHKTIIVLTSILFILITSGITSESIRSFMQAGWLMPGEPLWNSSGFIAEPSIVGQLLYSVFSYEATPTPEEVIAWVTTLTLQSILLLKLYFYSKEEKV